MGAADDLTTLVPRLDAPTTAPSHLPRRALDGEEEVDDRVARRMVSLLGSVLGNGQAGNARRDDSSAQWRRDGDELRWLDTGHGRLRLTADADWVSVNPLPHAALRAELRRLAARSR
ncbi:ESX secretion-associated protein EspG [Actinophytocola gossypii]|uniref:ESX secretion-associated protein EspG n=1 Tax=Actinophytocola gossypii TaxID=2812003 RepID=A0ABT2JI64_9PSEU|nr:ESX secretion-associated protein EspG [Actinophytocola gossypii]MCT2587411.1 ESX secretion-associated protein EspG [Actinophytocola gossypii]